MRAPHPALRPPQTVGIALGAGSARGIAHIGVLQELRDMGIEPQVICGCSMGALVGASYATGHLDALETWVTQLNTRDILRYMGIRLLAQGGVAEANALIAYLSETFGNPNIEDLPVSFATVATDFYAGKETWLERGLLWDAVRASIAIPGLITPVAWRGRWLVDGALVNPVPVSVCRALGADIVIAVNPCSLMRSSGAQIQLAEDDAAPGSEIIEDASTGAGNQNLLGRLGNALRGATDPIRQLWSGRQGPGTLEVMQGAITIMQDRITRSRLAGEPPDVMLLPHVNHIGLLEYHRADEAIAAGRACVRQSADAIRHALDIPVGVIR
ncbi:MAG: hypothetical protein JWM78_3328 [Verrucomicrobiaceae bacterium]|nr:hypothetical protein [Verrucomicrobiaceae bacterium]